MPHRPSREVEAIVAGRHDDPFAFLGMHKSAAGIFVRAMLPILESQRPDLVVYEALHVGAAEAEMPFPPEFTPQRLFEVVQALSWK